MSVKVVGYNYILHTKMADLLPLRGYPFTCTLWWVSLGLNIASTVPV